jgi:hypothetical protein
MRDIIGFTIILAIIIWITCEWFSHHNDNNSGTT